MPTYDNAQRPARMRDLGAGVKARLPAYTTYRDDDLDVEVEVELDLVGDQIACTQLRAIRGTLTGRVLRRLPVLDLLRSGLTWSFTAPAPEDYPETGPTPAALRYVAQVYRCAYVTGQAPTKAVEDTGLSRATAGRWIARARTEGFLEPAEGPGKAGG